MLGLPQTGTYDPETKSRVESYQTILGQTPGQTNDMGQWDALTGALTARDVSFTGAVDSTPAQDLANNAFMREAGAQESELMGEIAYRTSQYTSDVNMRAQNRKTDTETANKNAAAARTDNARRVGADYASRGFASNSGSINEIAANDANIQRGLDDQILGIDRTQAEGDRQGADALTTASRNLYGEGNRLYRRRADSIMKSGGTLSDANNQRAYGN
jgi:hypothetical protein